MWKRLDDGLAKGEAAFAGLFLMAMIVLAVVQVVVDNSAVRAEMAWAQDIKVHLGWIDNFLERATVILAFLGASLAVPLEQTHRRGRVGARVSGAPAGL